jgi:uncharacterized protein
MGLNFMQFIPCIEADTTCPGSVAAFSVTGEAYGKFLCKTFDLWLADISGGIPTTSIRFFESLLFKYAGFPPTECTLLEECGSYVLVEHEGDVYTCDFFVEPKWKLGNLLTTPLISLANFAKQKEFGKLKADLHGDCRVCDWKELCRGGCIKDRLRDLASNNLNHFCGAFKIFFPYADRRLRRLADDWRKNQPRAI